MADLGLSSSDEESSAPKSTINVPASSEQAAVAVRSTVDDGLGLSDSSDDDSGPPLTGGAEPPKINPQVPDLGLSDSEDEDAPVAPSHTPKYLPVEDLGLDSDSDDERIPPTGAGGSAAAAMQQQEETVVTTHTFKVPSLARPSSSATSHTVKIPPQVHVETDEFNPSSSADAVEQFVERSLPFQNQILWRYKRDDNGEVVTDPASGVPLRESNARLVKWSDGSLQLHVGSEVYEVTNHKAEQGFIFAKQTNFLPATTAAAAEEGGGGGSAVSGKTQTVLECHGQVESRYALRLAGIDGEALRKKKSKTQQQHTKGPKVKTVAITSDPFAEQAEREKKARARAKRAPARGARKTGARVGQRGGGYDNNREQFDESNISDIKSQFYRKGGGPQGIANDDDDDDDDDEDDDDLVVGGRARPARSAQEESDDEDDDDDEDDSDEVMHNRKKMRKGDVEDDDSDEEGGGDDSDQDSDEKGEQADDDEDE